VCVSGVCVCVCVLGGQEAHSTFQPLPQSSAPSSFSLPGSGSRIQRTVGNVYTKVRRGHARGGVRVLWCDVVLGTLCYVLSSVTLAKGTCKGPSNGICSR